MRMAVMLFATVCKNGARQVVESLREQMFTSAVRDALYNYFTDTQQFCHTEKQSG
jgi:hypothetical protein